MSELDFTDISFELRGALTKGRLKSTDTSIVFKHSKTGKLEQVSSEDIDTIHWHRFAGHWGIRIFAHDGSLIRFGGFRESDKEKLSRFFSNRFGKTMVDMDFCYKGWNWGTAKFKGSVLSFEVANSLGFDVPLSYVSQCTTGKNEVTLEFHQNDDAEVSLMELRFHMPAGGELSSETEPMDAFKEQVLRKADVISAIGDAMAIFREVQCVTPRGRYDIKVFQTFFQLHGKTFDYKIPMSTVLRLFLLPHKDSRQMYFVMSLDPPIKQGQTRYHYLVFLFTHEEECSVELPLTEEELQTKYEGKLSKEISGATYEVVSKIMKVLINRKITGPGKFIGHSGTPSVACSYKAAAGYIYPLERGFMFVHKPPLHIRFEEITGVNFARGGGTTRSFDFEVETKSGVVHTFSSIEKEEYPVMFDFINNKKLRIKNSGKLDKPTYLGDYEKSGDEEEPDAYLARVKAEAEERSDDGGSEESEDEDYNPEAGHHSDVAEEFDSFASESSDSGSGESDGEGGGKKKKEKKKKAKTIREPGPRREKKQKSSRKKDKNEPKRPASAYMIFLSAQREGIKAKYPDLSMIEISKKGGEMWRELTDKSEWEAKYQKAKEEYKKVMADYKPTSSSSPVSKKKKKTAPRKKSEKSSPRKESSSASGGGAGAGFKSKEFISDDDSSGSDDSEKAKTQAKTKVKKEKVKSEAESEEESETGGGSESGSD